MICVLAVVGIPYRLVLGDRLSTDRLGQILFRISSRLLRCRVSAVLPCGKCGRSGDGAGCVCVGFLFGFGIGRSVMGCGVVRHR